jgi:diguanylate cyclase (GGDEF)-like protein
MNTSEVHLDELTQLPEYEACVSELGLRIDGSQPVAIVLVDIDWFGRVNLTRGRDAGDTTIAALGQFLSDQTVGRAQVFRYGGDAFMLILPQTEKEQAFIVAEGLRRDIATGVGVGTDSDGANSRITVSCGVAAYPDDGNSASGILRKVCEGLYRAKVSGRNKAVLAREERMVTKTVHYTQGQLEGLARLAQREDLNEATLLREALDDLLRKYNS